MACNRSVTTGNHFISAVQAARYGSARDVVRAGLRLLEEHETRVRALQNALFAGEQSGEPRPFDSEELRGRMQAKRAAGHYKISSLKSLNARPLRLIAASFINHKNRLL